MRFISNISLITILCSLGGTSCRPIQKKGNGGAQDLVVLNG